jgi:RNA polymerase sigma factor (sigma-70 family)
MIENEMPEGRQPMSPAELLNAVRRGECRAWTELVRRFQPLVRAIAHGYRLNDRDAEDVGQTVWLRLVENIDRIREPRALPSWLITTTRHESLRLVRAYRRTIPVDPLDDPTLDIEPDHTTDIDAELLRGEEATVLAGALAELPTLQRELLLLLTDDQDLSYRDISTLLTMPVGSIGPTRARGLARLREMPAVRAYLVEGDGLPAARPA